MKAEELRIGNWVVWNFSLEEIQVTADTFNNSFSGIPLTEEWLLRFGFDEGTEPMEFYIKDYIFGVALDHKVDGILSGAPPLHIWDGSFTGAPCLYVHQIQNLYFALTGEELKITSEKEKPQSR